MSVKPTRVHTTKVFRLKTKDVKKGYNINVAGIGMKVLTNDKNYIGDRVLTCSNVRDKSETLLILPKNLMVHVTRCSTKTSKK